MSGILTVDLLSAEIGSTITAVNAFEGLFEPGQTERVPRFIGQGTAPTSVDGGDVLIGLQNALTDLAGNLGAGEVRGRRFTACSSAAGGLRMSVHGLVYDMTVKAAREACLGAGANLVMVTAGPLRVRDLEKLLETRPNIILLAGGLDYGERDTALDNAQKIRAALLEAGLAIPLIYAGNVENQAEIQALFEAGPIPLHICDNVYPKIDELNVEPARRIIQRVFESHITEAPGMEHIRDLVEGPIMPVPGAVMRSAQLLQRELGDLMVFDVGGATTDVHSVCTDSPEVGPLLVTPEPMAKRTVEGDLGVFVGRKPLTEVVGSGVMARELGIDEQALAERLAVMSPVPVSPPERALARLLAYQALVLALQRHAGKMRDIYTAAGKTKLAEGKDLSALGLVIGTGGALTRLPHGRELLRRVLETPRRDQLCPRPQTPVLLDNDYIMASMGTLADDYPEAALQILKNSLGGDHEG